MLDIILPYITLGSAVLTVVAILLQQHMLTFLVQSGLTHIKMQIFKSNRTA